MINLGSFEPAPNGADWSWSIEVLDDDTGTPFPFDGYLIEMEVVDPYVCRRLYGSTSDGKITLNELGFEFLFPAGLMRDLRAGPYTVNIRFTDSESGAVEEPVIAALSVIEGGFRS